MDYSSSEFEAAYTYSGNDLGAVWSSKKTVFRLWAPTAEEALVNLFRSGTWGTDDCIDSFPMERSTNGTWVVDYMGDLNGVYYTYTVRIGDYWAESIDPYARSAGVNGKRGLILDLQATNPPDWENDKNPNPVDSICDCVLYELHVRDFSIHASSKSNYKGKFLALTEDNAQNKSGIPLGIHHIKSLGVTHLHLLPIFDFGSVDESLPEKKQFNWGYDPMNYNFPEGSYATDPFHGEVRVRELKQAVHALHKNGISVIMDVVYNHVYDAGQFSANKLVPGYFSRIIGGKYANGSFCGNDTASERSMVRKFIVDSVNYWADEYHIDGFRFDIVGLLDLETVNEIVHSVSAKHPGTVFYGEGWEMPTQLTRECELATQHNAAKMPHMALFNDCVRDGLRGSSFNGSGLLAGNTEDLDAVAAGFLGNSWWCPSPEQTINYASCHDDHTLYDRIRLIRPDRTQERHLRMNRLAAAFIMTAQGVPFLQAGEELLRTKTKANGDYERNSYRSSDRINCIKWNVLEDPTYQAMAKYYQGLIAFRKAHPALRMRSAQQIRQCIRRVYHADSRILCFLIHGKEMKDSANLIYIAFNPSEESVAVPLPPGKWQLQIDAYRSGTQKLATLEGRILLPGISAAVLIQ